MMVGRAKLAKHFKNLAAAGELFHGYIFFGERRTGKFTFAERLAYFLETGAENFDGPFDGALIDAKIILPFELTVDIDAAREIKKFLSTKPLRSPKKTVIVDGAENLTGPAQNALLKITEEPPSHGLIILIVTDPEILLPALVSRFQRIYFPRLADGEILRLLKAEGFSERASESALKNSFGRPGLAWLIARGDGPTVESLRLAREFLAGGAVKRSEIIASISDDEEALERFVEFVSALWRREVVSGLPSKNLGFMKNLLSRFRFVGQFNTNRRLQMAAVLDL